MPQVLSRFQFLSVRNAQSRRRSLSFRFKTVLGIACIETIMLYVLVTSMLQYLADSNLEAMRERAKSSAHIFALAIEDAATTYDLATLDAVVNEMLAVPSLIHVSVRDREGFEMATAGIKPSSSVLSDASDYLLISETLSAAELKVGEVDMIFSAQPVWLLIEEAQQHAILLSGLLLLMVAIFSTILAYFLTKKLNWLKKSALRIGAGDLSTPIYVGGNDEVDTVAVALDQTRTALMQSHSELTEKNKILIDTVKQLNLKSRKLREAQEREARLFSVIGHELRTPLAAMHMLAEDAQLATTHHYGSAIEGYVKHSLLLVDEMSLMANSLANKMPTLEPLNLGEVVKDSLLGLDKIAEKQGVKVEFSLVDHVNRKVMLPKRSIMQSLINIVNNSIKHSQGDRIRIRLSLKPVADEKVGVELRITDNGIGVPPNEREKIFDSFVRGSVKTEGTGIGLNVARRSIRQLGGDITYLDPALIGEESGAGFVLKVTADACEPDSEVAESDSKKPLSDQILKGRRVLVAEDNPTIQMLTTKMLEKLGAIVVSAMDGQEALEFYQQQSVDLVITDICMPRVDGYALATQLREDGYKGPIIGVTASTLADERDRLIASGSDEALAKPLNKAELLATLNRLDNSSENRPEYVGI